MRLKAILIPAFAFGLAGLAAGVTAQILARMIEDRSVIAVKDQLASEGHTWASVMGDGLQIIIEGEAPSEATRFRAISAVGAVVDPSRVIDVMTVAATEEMAPPTFAVEILRNDGGVSLSGLVPLSTDRDALIASIRDHVGDQPIADLLEHADYPAPAGWAEAMGYAVEALGQLPRSKISVGAAQVDVIAITDSEDQQRTLESALTEAAPEDITLDLSLSAPRPVITPFTVRYVLDDSGPHFDACAADTIETQNTIVEAAVQAGVQGQINCPLGLGVPTTTWGDAVALGITAVTDLGGGTVTFSDADVRIVALEGTPQATFDDVVGTLTNSLPDVFALEAVLPETPAEGEEGPPRFSITLSPEGEVQLRGRVADALMNSTAENFARAKFGNLNVTMGTRLSDDMPAGWSVRVLAAIEAASYLSNGAVIVEGDSISVRGNTGDPDASAEISRLMIDKLGAEADFTIEVSYIEELDPVAGLPSPEECVAQIFALTADRKITFDPGSTELSASAQPIIDDIAEIFRRCPDLEIEIAGFTDSQGREVMNRQLSQDRANAVLNALRLRRIPVGTLRAVGYGEDQPIADNGTEAGREENRRIEFRLIEREVPEEEPTGLEALEAGLPEEPDEETPEEEVE